MSIYSFLKEQGYVWDSQIAGHNVIAPKGKQLKNKIEQLFRYFLNLESFNEIETPLIYPKSVWENSGHWDKFNDPIIKTTLDKSYRVDKLLEEHFENIDYSSLEFSKVVELLKQIEKNVLKVEEEQFVYPDGEIELKSLMMKTMSGKSECGLRPETATATYQHFMEQYIYCGKNYPIKVFQLGKSFRNEINPKHNLLRGREFSQLEIQTIFPVKMKDNFLLKETQVNGDLMIQYYDVEENNNKYISFDDLLTKFNLKNSFWESMFFVNSIIIKTGFSLEKIRWKKHSDTEKAFYAIEAWDLEINLRNIGWTEILGVHDRGDYDLSKVLPAKFKEIPHILEIAIGLDRLLYALIDNLYQEKAVEDGKSMLSIPYHLAPVQVSVLPLKKNHTKIKTIARDIFNSIKSTFVSEYNDKKAVGKIYLQNAMRGIPYSVTVDFQTLEDDTITVRDRDTENQERVPKKDLITYLVNKFAIL
jgi:glycyl-tRNA synthetase